MRKEDLINKTCCFTGHRIIPKQEYDDIKNRLVFEIEELISQGVIYFGVGGALGFDTLVAQTIINLKDIYSDIRLILVLPCIDQTKFWNSADIQTYEYIKKKADKIEYTSKYYTKDCMHIRNNHLVENSKYCICYLNKDYGGTFYTVNSAKNKGLNTVNLSCINI